MIRPFTCVCLVLAAGSGLYLYQVKQRAFALDASLRSTFHDIDVARERTRMLRADWALVNDPERLQALAGQYLTLQPMQPSQLLTMDQLAAALPPSVPFGVTAVTPPASGAAAAKPAPVLDPTHGVPMAEAAPVVLPHTRPVQPEVALLQPVSAPAPAAPSPAAATTPQQSNFAASAPHLIAPPANPPHHSVHHSAPQAPPKLAEASGLRVVSRRHAAHNPKAAAAPAARQFFAANVLPREADPEPRITPQAATVMYSAVAGSSLGMASSASLAPPRPLYSTSQ